MCASRCASVCENGRPQCTLCNTCVQSTLCITCPVNKSSNPQSAKWVNTSGIIQPRTNPRPVALGVHHKVLALIHSSCCYAGEPTSGPHLEDTPARRRSTPSPLPSLAALDTHSGANSALQSVRFTLPGSTGDPSSGYSSLLPASRSRSERLASRQSRSRRLSGAFLSLSRR